MKRENHSNLTSLLFLFLIAIWAVGIVSAVTISGEGPPPAEPGETVEMQATIEEPFRNAPDQWTLQGTTELEHSTWTIQVVSNGDPITTQDYSGDTFTNDLDSASGATSVEIQVSGQVPTLASGSNYRAMALSRGTGANSAELSSWNGQIQGDQTPTDEDETASVTESEPKTPSQDQGGDAVSRGFFSNDPNSDVGILDNALNITTLGFALSIIGILMELRRGG